MECLETANALMENALDIAARGGDLSSIIAELGKLPCSKQYLDLLRGGEPAINAMLATTHYAQYLKQKPTPALIKLVVEKRPSEADLAKYILGRPADAGIATDLLFHLVMGRVTGDSMWERRLETRLRLIMGKGMKDTDPR